FFQAEDGIRDFHVTGVQTCALPIFRHGRDGDVAWSTDGQLLFGALEVEEPADGGIEAAARIAYTRLGAFLAQAPVRHLLRVWNRSEERRVGKACRSRWWPELEPNAT